MSDKTDATFLIALVILTIFGLVVSSAAHSEDLSAGISAPIKPMTAVRESCVYPTAWPDKS